METTEEMFTVDYEDASTQETVAEAPEEPKTFLERVCELQSTVKAPKDLFNAYGGFKYRSKESILEAAKPVAKKLGLMILVDDDICRNEDGWHYIRSTASLTDVKTGEKFQAHGWAREPESKKGMDPSQDDICRNEDGWHYIRSTASLTDVKTGEKFQAHGWAREPESKKGMDPSQITGTAASYAGKRALGNLLSIDDTADADGSSAAPAPQVPAKGPFTARCQSCGTTYQFESPDQYNSFVAHATCCPAPQWAPIQ